MKTLLRYYADWKKRDGIPSVKILKEHMAKNPEFNARVVNTLAKLLGMTQEEVIVRLQKPWGLAQLLNGKLPDGEDSPQSEVEERLEGALRFIRLCDMFHNRPKETSKVVRALMCLKDGETLVIVKNDGIIQLIGVTTGKTSQ